MHLLKKLQFNGRGTVSIKDFYAQDYGKVIRSCGGCKNNGGPRNIIVDGVVAKNGGALCAINSNFGGMFPSFLPSTSKHTSPNLESYYICNCSNNSIDTCKITESCQNNGKSCDRYKGVALGGEAVKVGSGPDGTSCTTSGFVSTC